MARFLGIGERVGNTPMDLLLVNLVLMGWIERDLTHLNDLVQAVSDATGEPIPDNYPVFGRDAFRTATGVHAAAVVKAFHKGDPDLADTVYSGCRPVSSADRSRLRSARCRGSRTWSSGSSGTAFPPTRSSSSAIFRKAKTSSTVLTESEIEREIEQAAHLRDDSPRC
jgi:2-isopropylmalate synthase